MKILWIDDEPDILYLCSSILSKHGHEVYTLQSSKNVLPTISETRPDVILLDHWMPEMTGIEVMKQLKQSPYANIPVIMCTSNPEVRAEAELAGANSFITKPFSMQQMEDIIAETYRVYSSNSNRA